MKDITLVLNFKNKTIRRAWDDKNGKWYFSVVDIIAVLTDSIDPSAYWRKLKERLKTEGNQTVTNCHGLKLLSRDNKYRLTDVADVGSILRLIQSIPSPKAEPFKLWLAKVGNERLQETVDPERSIIRARNSWKRLGYSDKWIQQRMMGLETRNKLTDYWRDHQITKQNEYAILTNLIHQEWSDLTVKEHKALKGLETENLRDHMTEAELIFTALAELSTREIADSQDATGFNENIPPALEGGRVAKNAKLELENKMKKKIVSPENMLKTELPYE